MGRTHLIAIIAAALVATGTPAAFAAPAGNAIPLKARGASIVARAPVVPPFAFIRYCLGNAPDCMAGGGSAKISLSPKQLRQLRQVNFSVNRSIRPRHDRPGEDEWLADVAAGDCEDYVLTKRRRLIALGWSAKALRIAITHAPGNVGHAVLIVSTTKGDLVLDNRNNAVLDWRDTDLRWRMIQSSDNPFTWHRI